MNKKAQFQNLGALAIGIVTLTITLVVGFLIMSQGQTQIGSIEGITITNATQCAASGACNAVTTLRGGLDDIPGWLPLIVIVVIGALLLGLIRMIRG